MIHINSKNINLQNLQKNIDTILSSLEPEVKQETIKFQEDKVISAKKEEKRVESKQKILIKKPRKISFPTPKQKTIYIRKNAYEINDFLRYNNESFIYFIYKVLLNRVASHQEVAHYLELLYSGRQTKMDILLSIRFSPEGKKNSVNILGAKKRYFKSKLYRTPILGYILKSVETFLRIPKLIQKINSLESIQSTKVPPELLYKEVSSLKSIINDLTNDLNNTKDELNEYKHSISLMHTQSTETVTALNAKLYEANEEIQKLKDEIPNRVSAGHFNHIIRTLTTKDEFYYAIDKKIGTSIFHQLISKKMDIPTKRVQGSEHE